MFVNVHTLLETTRCMIISLCLGYKIISNCKKKCGKYIHVCKDMQFVYQDNIYVYVHYYDNVLYVHSFIHDILQFSVVQPKYSTA